MTIRLLDGVAAAKLDPDHVPWPADSIVAVAEAEGKVQGRSAIISLPHIEGTWVAQSHRSTTLAYRLVRTIEGVLKRAGKTHAFAFIEKDRADVFDYMQRLGYREMPFTVLSKEL